MDKPQLNIPIIFQKLKHFETTDTRFMQVKIWLMHLAENFNGSYFDKDIVEEAIPTLANTPILAYIEDNSEGEKDFSDHRMILTKEDGKYKYKYIGQAIGVIPETNNAQFEMRLCDDGVEREFLTVEGLVWQNKWDDAPDILNRDLIKAQSMELHDDYEGEFREDNLFHFTKFKFYGACGLGGSSQPAMHNATIEVQFSFDGFQKEIQERMEQFKQFTQVQSSNPEVDINFSEKEVNDIVTEEEKLALLAKYSLTQEGLSFEINQEMTLEELENKIKEQFSLSAEQFKQELRNQLRNRKKMDKWGWEYQEFWYVDYVPEESLVIVQDSDDNFLLSFPYSVSGDQITIDFEQGKRVKVTFVPMEAPYVEEGTDPITDFRMVTVEAHEFALQHKETQLETEFAKKKETTDVGTMVDETMQEMMDNMSQAMEDAKTKMKENMKGKGMMSLDTEPTVEFEQVKVELDTLKQDFATLKEEADGLRAFKTSIETEQRKDQEQELFAQYEEKLTDIEEFEVLKQNATNYTIENLEKELALLFVKKTQANFSINKDTKKTTVKLGVKHNDDVDPYGGLIKK